MILKLCVFVFASSYQLINGQLLEGDQCQIDGRAGIQKKVDECATAQLDISEGSKLATKYAEIVCCLDLFPKNALSSALRVKREDTSTPQLSSPVCPPIDPSLTANKTGRPAWDKCIEYQEYAYLCEESILINDGTVRKPCDIGIIELIVGGEENPKRGEFPHMALLGYRTETVRTTWLCAGSLISDRFVLTSGRCTAVPITVIRLGVNEVEDLVDQGDIFGVEETITHPNYNPSGNTNDIGLVKTDRPVSFSRWVVPACLHIGDVEDQSTAYSTGWPIQNLRYIGNLKRSVLQEWNNCEMDKDTQLCYGPSTRISCHVSLGGPLQVLNERISCMYNVIGVAYGNCGSSSPGQFTRVSAYVPWIERIVWP